MLKAPDSNFKKLAAIDPVAARQYAKVKSASIEANNDQPNSPTTREHDFDEISLPNTDFGDQTEDSQSGNNSASSSKASRSFLTPSPGGLKPSVSTSCLLTSAEDSSKSTSNLICFPTRASLTHEWKKLKTPNKCRECNFLVYFNGRECSFCGFVAHKKCVTILVIKCSGQRIAGSGKNRKQAQSRNQTKKGKSPSVQPLFGQPLDIIDCNQVVDFMRRFVYEIDTRGLALKGIYRVSSIKSKVDKLCNYYDQHLSCLVDLSAFHPNVIANALKNYLRQLPEPLLTNKLYNEFINIAKKYPKQSSPNQPSNNSSFNNQQQQPTSLSSKPWKPYSSLLSMPQANLANNPNYNPMLIVELKDIVDLLPQINRDVIAIIMRHLKRVANMSEENQMSATNLSIIFGPTLLSSSENNTLAIVDNVHQARVVELMIIWANQIFPQYENYESKVDIDINVQEYD